MVEIFKDIPWYEGLYQVSNLGNVKSLNSWRRRKWMQKILKSSLNNKWYCYIVLCKDWKQKHFLIHRLVAITFLDKIDLKILVNHKDWIKLNNNLENLEFCDYKDNALHSWVNWLSIYTEKARKNNWLKTNRNPSIWKFWILNKSSKKVDQYDLEWNFIKTWDSMSNIWRELSLNISSISRCCSWKMSITWWYKWYYS